MKRLPWIVAVGLIIAAVPAVVGRAQIDFTRVSCGYKGGPVCNVLDWEYKENGDKRCDRGLKPGVFTPGSPWHCVNDTRSVVDVDDWTDWALRNQLVVSAGEPIFWVPRLGAHNAYNNTADGYPFPNHYWSITDQFRLGSRHLELDIHWFNNNLRVCHGTDKHVGCGLTDRLYSYAIKEIADWLDANPDEVISIDLEDYAEGHDDYVINPIKTYLGSRVLVPDPGQNFPAASRWTTRAMLATSATKAKDQVVIWDNNDQHGADWLFWNIQQALPSALIRDGQDPNVDFRPASRTCLAGTALLNPPVNLTQLDPKNLLFSFIFEDHVFFQAPMIDEATVEQAMHCNVSVIALDNLAYSKPPSVKPFDLRQDHAVWSWKRGDYGNKGDAALLTASTVAGAGGDWHRWESRPVSESHPFACARPRSETSLNPSTWVETTGANQGYAEGFDWKVTSQAGAWKDGGRACYEEFGPGYVFSVPVSGYQNVHAGTRATAAGEDVWINYNDIKTEGRWTINRRPLANAGPDLAVGCSVAGTTVTLDASASTDPESDPLAYEWSWPGGSATGQTAQVHLPKGVTTVTLLVDDGFGGVSTDHVQITLDDSTPPEILSAAVRPVWGFPLFQRDIFFVRAFVEKRDACAGQVTCRITSIEEHLGDQPKGRARVHRATWTRTGPLEFVLAADRSARGSRLFTVTIRCVDAAGNATTKAVAMAIDPLLRPRAVREPEREISFDRRRK